MELKSTGHLLYVNAEGAARVRPKEHNIPITAAEEERQRRKTAWRAQQARQYYEEIVLKKPRGELVQIDDAAKGVEEKVPV